MKVVWVSGNNYVLIFARLDVAEDIFDSSGYDTSLIVVHVVSEAFHGVGFSCACLSVGENGSVVTFQGAAYRQSCGVLVNLLLWSFIVVYMVEGVLVFWIIVRVVDVRFKVVGGQGFKIVVFKKLNSFAIWVYLHCWYENVPLQFPLQWRSHSYDYLYVIIRAHFAFLHHLFVKSNLNLLINVIKFYFISLSHILSHYLTFYLNICHFKNNICIQIQR